MRLIRLRLQNFRQHVETEIRFRPGLTGIIGANGSGKSTILEAIAWAIYGASAARGTNDTIRFARAPGRARVQVELELELGGHEFRIVRTMHAAEVYLDGGETAVATTLGGVTEYLRGRLGMSREEFFNTYFTGQKELQFLAQLGAAQRGRFLGQVLGYERLRWAQERARARRNELRHEIEGQKAGLPDPQALRIEREAALRRRSEALVATERETAAARELTAARDVLQPRWEVAQARREQARELGHALDVAAREREVADRDLERIDRELASIGAAEAELAPMRGELAQLPEVAEASERLGEAARLAERRNALEEAERQLLAELGEMAVRLEKLEGAPRLLEQFRQELEGARVWIGEAETVVQRMQRDWIGRRQETETKLQTYRDRAQELKEQIQQLRAAGPDGICPTCERPLGGQFEAVVGRLEDEWDTLVQDGKWLKHRLDQLTGKPEELAAAEASMAADRKGLEELNQKVARCERAQQELTQLRGEWARRQELLEERRKELATLPSDYDRDRHRAADARLRALRTMEQKAARLAQIAEARPARQREREEARERSARAVGSIAQIESRLGELAFAEDEFVGLRAAYEKTISSLHRAEVRETELRGTLQAAEEAVELTLRADAAYRERRAALDALELEQRHHADLDAALNQLRAELNARVRPELGQLASGFLTEITDSRYTALEIDDDYNILVLDEGEEKPVISGGEEDIANLVLRLAISQMIAERAGHPLSVLILDEVFGSLDLERRDNVIELLHKLGDRFEQVILITHVETIREGLDQVIRVTFDERTGASVVTDGDVRDGDGSAGAIGGEEDGEPGVDVGVAAGGAGMERGV